MVLARAGGMNGKSVLVGTFPALAMSVQMTQTAAQRFDLLLVRNLLPFGQLQGLQHFVHVFQRAAERLDDMIHLFYGLLNSHR